MMKFKPALAFAAVLVLLSGCANPTVGLRSGNPPSPGVSAPPPGTSYSSGSLALQTDVSPGAYFGMLFLGYLISGTHYDYWRPDAGDSTRRPPGLTADRSVVERDCSQPVEPLYANLRCK